MLGSGGGGSEEGEGRTLKKEREEVFVGGGVGGCVVGRGVDGETAASL